MLRERHVMYISPYSHQNRHITSTESKLFRKIKIKIQADKISNLFFFWDKRWPNGLRPKTSTLDYNIVKMNVPRSISFKNSQDRRGRNFQNVDTQSNNMTSSARLSATEFYPLIPSVRPKFVTFQPRQSKYELHTYLN